MGQAESNTRRMDSPVRPGRTRMSDLAKRTDLNDGNTARYGSCKESPRSRGIPMTPQAAYQQLVDRYREARLLESVGSVIGWDERTYMPPKGSAHRADQMALLAKLLHVKLTEPVLGELLDAVERSSLVAAPEADV